MKTTMIMEKKRILVVDDLASDTRLLKRFLEGTNQYVVREENDAVAALSAAEEFQPHLILLDILMPDMDGAELASCLRANPKLKAVPIVFLTAKLSKKEAELCGGQIGKYPFLAKPIVLPEVADCLEKLLK
jgi:CheY-like chemotaxis protein